MVQEGENGLLVPAGDTEALAEAIRRLAGDETLGRHLAERASVSPAHTSSHVPPGGVPESRLRPISGWLPQALQYLRPEPTGHSPHPAPSPPNHPQPRQ